MSIMGVTIQGPAGKDIGRLADVLVGQNGQPVAAVIDFGGFLGVGNRKVAVDWKSLKFSPGDKGHQITLELAPDQLRAAPDYKDQQPAPVVKPDATKPEAGKPEAGKPVAAKPDVPKPEAAKPDGPKPDAAKPDVAQPAVTKPGQTQPDVATPDAAKPDAVAPDAKKPDVVKPDAVKPGPSG
jgi:hypothetical protein